MGNKEQIGLILGSQSPRRKEILDFFTIPFKQVSPLFDESSLPLNLPPKKYVLQSATGKAKSLAKDYPNNAILTADTIVYFKGKIYLKPKSRKEAVQMLKVLSGNCHTVYSAVCVLKEDKQFCKCATTKICFHNLSMKEINTYLNAFNFLDKAGGYALQKGGSILIKSICGCFYNAMGLPIGLAQELLLKAGINLWDFLKPF